MELRDIGDVSESDKWVKTRGWVDASEARAELEASLAEYRSGR
jgi:inorganic pyrophosphatase